MARLYTENTGKYGGRTNIRRISQYLVKAFQRNFLIDFRITEYCLYFGTEYKRLILLCIVKRTYPEMISCQQDQIVPPVIDRYSKLTVQPFQKISSIHFVKRDQDLYIRVSTELVPLTVHFLPQFFIVIDLAIAYQRNLSIPACKWLSAMFKVNNAQSPETEPYMTFYGRFVIVRPSVYDPVSHMLNNAFFNRSLFVFIDNSCYTTHGCLILL